MQAYTNPSENSALVAVVFSEGNALFNFLKTSTDNEWRKGQVLI